jgi:hypothetical protein
MQPPPFCHHEEETGDKYLPLVMNQNEELLTVSNMLELQSANFTVRGA